jgi:hypothetical protein
MRGTHIRNGEGGGGAQALTVTWRHPQRRRRRYMSRAGPGCRGPGRTASWCADLRATPPPACNGTPASRAAVMKACLSVWGVTDLPIPARRAVLRTIRPAPCRSSRRPSAARNTGPSVRSPMARSIARAVRGTSGMVTTLPPLRVMVSVRCPRSKPSCSGPARPGQAGAVGQLDRWSYALLEAERPFRLVIAQWAVGICRCRAGYVASVPSATTRPEPPTRMRGPEAET